MIDYNCKICGKTHKLLTFMEFPQPDIISEISSGKSSDNIEIINKGSFKNEKEFYVKVRLVIPIVDFGDEFEILLWVKSEIEKFPNVQNAVQNTREIVFFGILDRAIPFYENTTDLSVQLLIDLDNTREEIRIIEIQRDIQLKHDLKNGITLNKLKSILSDLYHL